MTRHVVMFSAGGGSWAAAKRVAERFGTSDLTLLFTDILMEDEDAYRFLIEGAANVLGADVAMLTDRSGDGVKKPLTLRTLRERIEARPQIGLDFDDWNAGCACFLEAAE